MFSKAIVVAKGDIVHIPVSSSLVLVGFDVFNASKVAFFDGRFEKFQLAAFFMLQVA